MNVYLAEMGICFELCNKDLEIIDSELKTIWRKHIFASIFVRICQKSCIK